eukprot:TRINITY_DN1578_c3_g1_i1.p1 TRINITY_DN1578_c3_g1~~TRINITY_DN1578_c3_g1_i1.p1  ORF type:complete len:1396 (+),score=580.53 TRINITY_DN1578_c3_g1_i1:94-4188(+)
MPYPAMSGGRAAAAAAARDAAEASDAAFSHTLSGRLSKAGTPQQVQPPRRPSSSEEARHPLGTPTARPMTTPVPQRGMATDGHIRSELDALRAQLAGLEEEGRRVEQQRAIAREQEELRRRKRQQDEEEAMRRELIELRKYQEERRQERVRQQREEETQRARQRAELERRNQQIVWEATTGEAPPEPQKAYDDACGRMQRDAQDERRRSAASRKALGEALQALRQELAELDSDDWVQREAAERRREAQRRNVEEARRHEDAEEEVTRAAAAMKRKLSAEQLRRDELSALKQELLMLEKEAVRAGMMAEARAEGAREERERADERLEAEVERQVSRKEAAAGDEARQRAAAAELDRVHEQQYLLQRNAQRHELAAEAATQRAAEIAADPQEQKRLHEGLDEAKAKARVAEQGRLTDEDLAAAAARAEERGFLSRADFLDVEKEGIERCREEQRQELARLKEEERRLFEQELEAGQKHVIEELAAHSVLPPQENGKLERLLTKQRLAAETGPLHEVIQYAQQIAGVHAQVAAEEAEDAKRRIALLQREQQLLQELGDAARAEADRVWRAEQERAAEERVRSEARRKEQERLRAADTYARERERALAEHDVVRGERVRCLRKLQRLEKDDADAAARGAQKKREQLEAEVRRQEGRLFSAEVAAQRAADERQRLESAAEEEQRRQSAEAAEQQRQRELAEAEERARREDEAAARIQRMQRANQAKAEAAARQQQREEELRSREEAAAATRIQSAFRGKEARSTVEKRRAEVQESRKRRAQELLAELEQAEARAGTEAMRQRILDELAQLRQLPGAEAELQAQLMAERKSALALKLLEALLQRAPSTEDKTAAIAYAVAHCCAAGPAVELEDVFYFDGGEAACTAARRLLPPAHVVQLPRDGRAEKLQTALNWLVDETAKGLPPGLLCFDWIGALGERDANSPTAAWGIAGGEPTAAPLRALCASGWRLAIVADVSNSAAGSCAAAAAQAQIPPMVLANGQRVHDVRCDAAASLLDRSTAGAAAAAMDEAVAAAAAGLKPPPPYPAARAAAEECAASLARCLTAYRVARPAAFESRFGKTGELGYAPAPADDAADALRWLLGSAPPRPPPPSPPAASPRPETEERGTEAAPPAPTADAECGSPQPAVADAETSAAPETADRGAAAAPPVADAASAAAPEVASVAAGAAPSVASQGVSPKTITPQDATPDDKLADLECRVAWLHRQLDEERKHHAERERERAALMQQARQRELAAHEHERVAQEARIEELTGLLQEHQVLVDDLQRELEELIEHGPTAEDRERGRAAVRIQAQFRGHITRKEMRASIQRRRDHNAGVRLNEAATMIQKIARGRQGRKRAAAKRRQKAQAV